MKNSSQEGRTHIHVRMAEARFIRESLAREKIKFLREDQLKRALSLIWGTTVPFPGKLDKIFTENSINIIKGGMEALLYGKEDVVYRMSQAADKIDYMGIAILSEILCKVYPERFYINNGRSRKGLKKIDVRVSKDIKKYDAFTKECEEVKSVLAEEVFVVPINALHTDWFLEGLSII